MESTPVAAAVVQAAPVLFDTPRTLEKLVDLTSDAARRGANLVVFPEAFVGGYPKGLDFGARLGIRLSGRPRGFPPLLRQRHRLCPARRQRLSEPPPAPPACTSSSA